jgi:hypothetical protein
MINQLYDEGNERYELYHTMVRIDVLGSIIRLQKSYNRFLEKQKIYQ